MCSCSGYGWVEVGLRAEGLEFQNIELTGPSMSNLVSLGRPLTLHP